MTETTSRLFSFLAISTFASCNGSTHQVRTAIQAGCSPQPHYLTLIRAFTVSSLTASTNYLLLPNYYQYASHSARDRLQFYIFYLATRPR